MSRSKRFGAIAGGLLGLLVIAIFVTEPKAPPPAPAPILKTADLAADFSATKTLLQDYLAIDTTNPPGHEARAFPLLRGTLDRMGLTSTVAAIGEDRGDVWARLVAPSPDPGARPLLLLHHIDVVPAEREHWSVDPFAGVEKDGRIYGRGAVDMKHIGVVQLAALARLVKEKARLRRDVIFLAVSDEEQEGRGTRLAVERWIDDWKPEYVLDEGGFAVRDFMHGKDMVVVATTQKRVTKLRVVAHGAAGHGSRPIPDSGPEILRQALDRLAAHPPPVRLTPTTATEIKNLGVIAGFPKSLLLSRITWPGVLWAIEGTLTANKNLNPSLRDTMSLTILQAGQKDNVIPAEATALFDVRLLPDTRAEDFLAYVKGTLGDLPVTAELVHPPLEDMAVSPTDDPLYRALEASVRAHEPAAVMSPWLCVGATDSRFLVPKGVKSYGFQSVFVTKAQLDGIHGHDESIDVAELEKGVVVYAEALERFLLRGPT